jgi:hypothetical protein
MKKIFTVSALVLSMTGCATILQGTNDNVSIHALGATEKLTECTIKAGDNSYNTIGKVDQVVLDRSSKDLVIQCENQSQEGTAVVESSFNGAWLAADLLWDLCILTLSCPIDAATGAFFDYPNQIHVEMVNKDGSINEKLIIDKEELAKAVEAKKAEQRAKDARSFGPRS